MITLLTDFASAVVLNPPSNAAATPKDTAAIRKLRAPHPLVLRFASSLVTT